MGPAAYPGRWARGAEIDLPSLDTRAGKRRLCLPTYPFERKRLWVDIAPTAPALPVSPPDVAIAADVAAPIQATSTTTAPARPPLTIFSSRCLGIGQS